MSAPVFDPTVFGLSDQSPLDDLLRAQKAWQLIDAAGFCRGFDVGLKAGLEDAIQTLTEARNE